MEYLIGAAVALGIMLVLKMRAARTNFRNSDPLQHELLDALASRVAGQISDGELDQKIRDIADQTADSPYDMGDSIHDRLVHAASLAPMQYRDRAMVSAIRKLARDKYVGR